jgi:hypothetical protein
MFQLSYPAIIRELIDVDIKQLVASHRVAIIHKLQFVFFVIYVDLQPQNNMYIGFQRTKYRKSVKYTILRPNVCCEPLLMLCGRDL